MEKSVFFVISSLVPEIFTILHHTNEITDNVMSGSSMVLKHKINKISPNKKAMFISKPRHQYCVLRNTSRGTYFDVAMATPLVPDLFYAE